MPKFLRARCVDGYLAVHLLTQDAHDRAQQAKLPVLLVNATNWSNGPSANYDDVSATRLALDRLTAKGHQRIAYLNNQEQTPHYSTQDRLGTYTTWARGRGVEPCILGDDPRSEEFVEHVRSLIAGPQAMTALLCYNDGLGDRVVRSLHKAGINIPRQISIAAFSLPPHEPDELFPLSGIEYDSYELGRMATIEMIDALLQKRPLNSFTVMGQWRDGATVREVL